MGQLGVTIGVLVLGTALAQGQTRDPGTALVCSGTQDSIPQEAPKSRAAPSAAAVSNDARDERPDGKTGAEVDLVAALPDAPSYVPLSTRQKFDIFLKSTYAPYTFFSAGFEATLAQAEGRWYGYGGGIPGWGKRFGASLADTEARKFIQGFVLASVLHQDPRYFRSTNEKVLPRAWYAATRVLVTRTDAGGEAFNSSEFLGAFLVTTLQNSYYPERERGVGRTAGRFLGALSSDASANLLREFWPDLARLFRRHAPEKIKEIEEKLPDSIEKVAAPH
jgi:hypothetical protein